MYLLARIQIGIVYWCTPKGVWGGCRQGKKNPTVIPNPISHRGRAQGKKPCHSNGTTGPKPREENFDNRAEENAEMPPWVSLAHLWSFHFIFKLTKTCSDARPENCPRTTIRRERRSKLTQDRSPSTPEIKLFQREKSSLSDSRRRFVANTSLSGRRIWSSFSAASEPCYFKSVAFLSLARNLTCTEH